MTDAMLDQHQYIKLISNLFGMAEGDVSDEMTMADSDVWDSLKHMELIATLESHYQTTFTMDEIVEMTSIRAVREILDKKLS